MPANGHVEVANVNGRLSAIDEAVIPVTDHGFLYGDSVYETVRTYRRRPFLLDRHLERLERSAASIRLNLPWSRDALRTEVSRTIAMADDSPDDLAIRIVTTRGNGPFGYDPSLCPSPNLIILARTLKEPSLLDRERGVSAIVTTVRRNPIEALDPRIKSSNLLNNILAAIEAQEAGADEAILFNPSGDLSEGTMSNIFLVSDGQLSTPSLECGLLAGLTRDLVMEIARESGITALEGRLGRSDLDNANEIFLTSSTREILPIVSVDGKQVGNGTRGTLTARLQEGFRRRVEAFLKSGADRS